METPILELKNITKRFPGVTALKNVSMTVNRGEIRAICGENGAGKSTLMKILSGSYANSEYEGEIWFDGVKQNFVSVADAKKCGIEMVYQELNLVLNGSIAENLYLNNLPGSGAFVDWNRLFSDTAEVLKQINLNADPKQPAGLLNSGQMQMLSIMRAVIRKPNIIVLDEPTSSLTDNEVEILFRLARNLKDQGVTILFISHKLEEIFALCDSITIIRDGEVISTDPITNVTNDELIERMVGRKLENLYPKETAVIGDEVLRVEHLTVPHPSVKGRNIVENISFSIRRGEILGLGGLVGAGRSESLGAVFGQIQTGVSKEVYIKGKPVTIRNPRDAKKAGIGFLTEERRLTGFIPVFSICHNLTLCILNALPGGAFINKRSERSIAGKIFDRLKVKAPSLDTQIINLSGGNQQKVVLGRWLLAEPEILFIDEPTKGIDVGAKAEIYKIMSELAANGTAIVMVSSDMPELIAMSDRVVVLNEGRITGEFEGKEITQENIMRAAIS